MFWIETADQGTVERGAVQFVGKATADAAGKALTIELIDLNDVSQFSKTLAPQGV